MDVAIKKINQIEFILPKLDWFSVMDSKSIQVSVGVGSWLVTQVLRVGTSNKIQWEILVSSQFLVLSHFMIPSAFLVPI